MPSVRAGNYTPNTTAAPYACLQAYKARPLNGIWATAPYLHNGSVPTLYDLLLPASPTPNDPKEMTYRPKTFYVGSREFDPKKVGFRTDTNGGSGFFFDTTLPSNSNAGHEYDYADSDRRPALGLGGVSEEPVKGNDHGSSTPKLPATL